MMILSTLIVTLAAASSSPLVAAWPLWFNHHSNHGCSPSHAKLCHVSNAKLVLPSDQTDITPPTHRTKYIALGVGIQNYTCSEEGTYTAIGAVAELFDISCLYGKDSFEETPDMAMKMWSEAPEWMSAESLIDYIPDASGTILGQHYFAPKSDGSGGAVPKWDFTSAYKKGDRNGFVVGAKLGATPAPTGDADVSWLQLEGVEGRLAKEVYRTHTRLGKAPPTCEPSSETLSVKYVSYYWFFG